MPTGAKQTPIYAPSASELVVNMWRQTDDRKVWYEWIVEVFASNTTLSEPESISAAAAAPPVLGYSQAKAKGKGKEKERLEAAEGKGMQGGKADEGEENEDRDE